MIFDSFMIWYHCSNIMNSWSVTACGVNIPLSVINRLMRLGYV